MPLVRLENFQQFSAINVLSDPGVIGGPVVIPNAIKVMLVWQLADGKVGRNVLGGSVSTSFAVTAGIAEAIRAALVTGPNWTGLAAFLHTSVSLLRVDLQDIRGVSFPVVSSTGAGTPGTSVSTALPSEVALCMTLRTNRTGPGGRGRYYMCGFASNATAAGDVVAPALIAAANQFTGQINSAMTASGITWSLLLPERAAYTGSTGTQHPARVATTLRVESAICRDNHWDSQRRRGLK